MNTDMQHEFTNLSPCPFCGAPGNLITIRAFTFFGWKTYRIGCLRGCVFTIDYENRADAITIWNLRLATVASTRSIENYLRCDFCGEMTKTEFDVRTRCNVCRECELKEFLKRERLSATP